jgi:Domain of unknown function (DUF6438)
MKIFGFLLGLAALALAACASVANPVADGPVLITLSRSACYGFCPIYSVSISGEGEVIYRGTNYVNVRGEQRARIAPSEVAILLTRFDAIGFSNLRDEYRAEITDLPTYTITLERNGRRKSVLDYAGVAVGMPEAVRGLQDEIDRVSGAARWVLRDGEPVRGRAEK